MADFSLRRQSRELTASQDVFDVTILVIDPGQMGDTEDVVKGRFHDGPESYIDRETASRCKGERRDGKMRIQWWEGGERLGNGKYSWFILKDLQEDQPNILFSKACDDPALDGKASAADPQDRPSNESDGSRTCGCVPGTTPQGRC